MGDDESEFGATDSFFDSLRYMGTGLAQPSRDDIEARIRGAAWIAEEPITPELMRRVLARDTIRAAMEYGSSYAHPRSRYEPRIERHRREHRNGDILLTVMLIPYEGEIMQEHHQISSSIVANAPIEHLYERMESRILNAYRDKLDKALMEFPTEPKGQEATKQEARIIDRETAASKAAWEESVLEYAKDVCRRSGIPWRDDWAPEVEGLATKIDVNKKIFLELSTRVEPIPGVPPELAEMLSKCGPPNSIKAKIQNAEEQIAQYFREIGNLERRMRDYSLHIRTQYQTMYDLFGIDEKAHYMDQVKKVLESGLYTFVRVSDDKKFVLRTTNPVLIHWKDADKSVDMKVPLGRFDVQVDMHRHVIRVGAAELAESHRPNGMIHPHINRPDDGSYWGDICWGNASVARDKFTRDGELLGALKALWLLLNNYNDESPYLDLSKFWLVQNKDKIDPKNKALAKAGRAWVYANVVTDASAAVEQHDSRGTDDDGECAELLVDVWRYRYMPYGVLDDDGPIFLCGPRGGNPTEISDGDVTEWD